VLLEGSELILSQTIPMAEKEDVVLELEKLCLFLKQKGAIDDQTPWALTGDSSGLTDKLSQIFPGQKLELSENSLALYAIPIGLALDVSIADESSVQFCQKEFTPQHTLQRRKKRLLHYLGLCLAGTLLMAMGGSFFLNRKQHVLIEDLQGYLSTSDSFSSPHQIEKKLREWESSLQGQKSSFAFLPTVPKVSDVLAWLSAHPSFATEEGGQKEGMEIKSLHYSLVKYPKIGDVSSPYSAQVELEFTSLTPRNARDFHEALLKGDQIVNAKKEIKWQTQHQTYHTAFELNKGIGS
jgi:type IV pilus assembly protein PilM